MADIARHIEGLIKQTVPLYEHMAVSLVIDDERFEARMPFTDPVKSHVGTIHPAFQWAAAELLGGLVALKAFGGLEDIFLVVRRVDIEFLRPARSDIRAVAEVPQAEQAGLVSRVAEEGEGTFELAMRVLDEQDTEVATARGVYLVRKRRPA